MSTYDAYNLSLRDSTEFTVPDFDGSSIDNVMYRLDFSEITNMTYNQIKEIVTSGKIPYYIYELDEADMTSFLVMICAKCVQTDGGAYNVDFYTTYGSNGIAHQFTSHVYGDPDSKLDFLTD